MDVKPQRQPAGRIRDLACLLFLEELLVPEWVERWARERGKLDALREWRKVARTPDSQGPPGRKSTLLPLDICFLTPVFIYSTGGVSTRRGCWPAEPGMYPRDRLMLEEDVRRMGLLARRAA